MAYDTPCLSKKMIDSAFRSLYRQVVCNVPISCKAKGDRNELGVWLDSDLGPLRIEL